MPSSRNVPAVLTLAFLVFGCGEPAAEAPADGGAPTPEAATAAPPDEAPPIVLISIDTLRSDRLPAYGYTAVETPAIDALRRDGVLFERAYAAVPLTLPSHATILTGLLPPGHGVRDNIGYRFDPTAVAYLPRLLRERGYATGAAVSAIVLQGKLGLADGFDVYEDSIEERPRAGIGGLQRPGSETLESILPWLRAQTSPLFLFFHIFEPHTPYEPPPSLSGRYASAYDGEVVAADRVVGRLLDELRTLGFYDDAVVVLLSDHGEGLGDHGEDEHGVLLYRESLQVPLILKLPGNERAGETVTSPVGLADVFPTLLELVGASDLPSSSGHPLLPSPPGRGAGGEGPRQLYAETYFPRLHFGWSELESVVEGRFHFIDGPDPELYDLVADPAETQNLLQREREVSRRLREALEERHREITAPAEVDPEERRRLEALGYVGVAAASGEGKPLPDPKSRLGTVRDLKEGLRLYSLGDFEGAARAYGRAVEENPQSLDAWEYLGRSLHELGRVDEALKAFDRALNLAHGKASHLAVASGLILLNTGRPPVALELLRRELERSPETITLRLLEARTLVLLRRVDEALASAELAVAEAPDNADAVYLRGAVRIGLGDLGAAETDLRRALELAPAHTAAMSDLAVLLERRGEREEARQWLRRVLEHNPGDQLARRHLENLEAPEP